MKAPFGKPGMSRFVFAALFVVFNWPFLSIPAPENLFAWLFTVWGLAIALLFLAAQRTGSPRAGPAEQSGPEPPATGPNGGGADAGGGHV